MAVWQRAIRLVRADNWWAKIPPLLAIAYAQALLSRPSAERFLGETLGLLVAIFAVAAYGHVVNDLYDIEVDQKAGKPNSMARLSRGARRAAVALTLAVAWLPGFWLHWGPLAGALVLVNLALPTLYSVPPVRLKERGILAVLADTLGAHAVPTLLVCAVLADFDRGTPRAWLALTLTATASAFLAGLRGILRHQRFDREADLRAGIETVATRTSPAEFARYLRWVYPAEMLALGAYLAVLTRLTGALVPVFVVFGLIELTRTALDWRFRFQPDDQPSEPYRPLTNNVFYELWLPVSLAAAVAARQPKLAWLPLAQVLVFWPTAVSELRDLLGLASTLAAHGRRWWQQTWFDPRLRRWQPSSWGGPAPRIRPLAQQGDAIRVQPRRGRWAGTQAATVQVGRSAGSLGTGQPYRVRFRARAEAPCVLCYGVSRDDGSRQGLGLSAAVRLSGQWQTFLADFLPTEDCPECRVFLLAEPLSTTLELSDLSLEPLGERPFWQVVCAPHYQVERIEAGGEEPPVRLQWLPAAPPREATGHGETHPAIEFRLSPGALAPGRPVRARAALRSEGELTVAVALKEASPPWTVLSLAAQWRVSSEWQTLEVDGLLPVDSAEAVLVLQPESERGSLEIGPALCEAVRGEVPLVLETVPGAGGQVVRQADSAWRRMLPLPGPDRQASDVRWVVPGQSIHRGQVYRCTLRARSDAPRDLVVDLVESRPPWRALGLWSRVPLDPAERSYLFEFQAIESEPAALLRFLSGSSDTPWELAQLESEPVSGAVFWALEQAAGVRARLVEGSSPSGCRVEPVRIDGLAESLRLVRGPWPLAGAGVYRLSLSARSDVARRASWRVAPVDGADIVRGGQGTLALGPEPHRYPCDLILDGVESGGLLGPTAVQVELLFGADAAPCEILAIELKPVAADATRMLDLRSGGAAHLEADSPQAGQVKVCVHDPGQQPDDVLLGCGWWKPEARGWYRVALEVRADQPRQVPYWVALAVSPWTTLAPRQTAQLHGEWQTLIADFQVDSPGLPLRLVLALGDQAGPIEVGSASLTPLPEQAGWQWLASQQAQGYLALVERESSSLRGARCAPGDGQLWLARQPFAVRGGQPYRAVISARAASELATQLRISQAESPWELLLPDQAVGLDSQWRGLVVEFLPLRDEPAVRIALELPPGCPPVEVGSVQVFSVAQAGWSIDGASPPGWQLECPRGEPEGIAAAYRGPGESPAPGRLLWSAPEVGGEPVRISMRVRGDRPSAVRATLAQAQPPWQALAPPAVWQIDSEWKTLVADRIPCSAASAARLVLEVEPAAGRVDFERPRLTEIARQRCWQLAVTEPGQAMCVGADTPPRNQVRVQVRRPGTEAGQIALQGAPLGVRGGTRYRVRFRLRASQAARVTASVAQAHEPWSGLGLWTRWNLDSTWRTYLADFVATADEDQARLLVLLGEVDGEVELDFADLTERPDRLPELVLGGDAAAALVESEEDPQTLEVVLAEPGSERWHVQLSLGELGVVAGKAYRLSLVGRSETPRRLGCVLMQAAPPWQTLADYRELVLSAPWEQHETTFVAQADDPRARVVLMLGMESPGAWLKSIVVEPMPEG